MKNLFRVTAIALLSIYLSACAIPINGLGGSQPNKTNPPPPSTEATTGASASNTAMSPVAVVATPYNKTFSGVVQNAQRIDERVTLTLFADQSWRMRRTELSGKQTERIDVGSWYRTNNNGLEELFLDRPTGDQASFVIESESKIRINDLFGEFLNSSLRVTLAEQFDLDPISAPVQVVGKLTSSGQYHQFFICGTNLSFEVSNDAKTDKASWQQITKDAHSNPITLEARFVFQDRAPYNKIIVSRVVANSAAVKNCD